MFFLSDIGWHCWCLAVIGHSLIFDSDKQAQAADKANIGFMWFEILLVFNLFKLEGCSIINDSNMIIINHNNSNYYYYYYKYLYFALSYIILCYLY